MNLKLDFVNSGWHLQVEQNSKSLKWLEAIFKGIEAFYFVDRIILGILKIIPKFYYQHM